MTTDDRGSPCGEARSIVAGPAQSWCRSATRMARFAAVGGETAVVVNLPTEHYNREQPDELRRALDDPEIPFDWFPKGG